MPTTPSSGVSDTNPSPALRRGPGRPRKERPVGEPLPVTGRATAAKRTTSEFTKSVVRMRAAKLMLAGPITPAALYGSKIGKRAAITSVVIAPWFSTTRDGQFKLTTLGRDEFVEAMDSPAPAADQSTDPDAPVKTGRQVLEEREVASPPPVEEGRRTEIPRRNSAGLPADLFE